MTNRMKSFLRSGSASAAAAASDANQASASVSPSAGVEQGSALSALIAHQDWDKLRMLLSTDVGQQAVQSELLTSPDYAAESALSFACRFHPPLDVIRALMDLLPPDVVRKTDPIGRSPLHVAAKWGAAPRVIRFLSEAYPDSGGLQDTSGKTPLHLACESYASKYSSSKTDDKPLKESMLEVVRFLCKLSPTTVNIEDNEDFTALEYAIENDLDIKVVRSLQKACEKDWKKRRAAAGGSNARHDDVRQTMLLQQQQSQMRLQMQQRDEEAVPQPSSSEQQHSQQQTEEAQPQPQPKRVRKRGSNLYMPGAGPGAMDVSDVSKALSALDQTVPEIETKSGGAAPKGRVPLSKPRKGGSTRAVMA
eukprot:CAMPEP_0178516230 /NCGR_PEP_ID=MMETSP0696-20121128/24994_1 /TAXON_ID=265572 /ORGANISM="Extubocellulus spinifer, Strain CCMP396" /LENGTH=363 /DNA_ID=CAMNT_0020146475 /DNA_START=248 /DNA_END=1339 /DNA_ORIENTATION=+